MDYTISKGDTLGAIAKKFNTDVNTLAKANNIANPNLIQAGAKLAIPSISAEKISTTPISIPPVPPPTKDPNAFVTSLQSQIQPLQQASDTASTNVNTAQQDLITLQKQLEGKTAEQIKIENEQNIPQINTELIGLQSEAQRLTTEYLNAIRNREAQGGVAAVVGADQKRIQSQAASDIGLINAQIQAKQGQLELARGTVDRAIAIKYEPLIQSLETKKLIYEMNKDSLSRADQKLLEAKNKEWTLQLDQYKKEQEDEKSMQDMLIDAQAQGAPASVIASAKQIIANGGKPSDVAVSIGKYSGASAKAELLKQQIKTEKAQQGKYYADTAKTKKETGLLGITGVNQETITKGIESKSGQKAIATKNLITQFNNLSKLYAIHGARPLTAEGAGAVSSARSAASLAIAEAFGQGAIQQGDREQYDNMIGTTFGLAPTAKLKQAIEIQKRNYQNQLVTFDAAYPGVGKLPTFILEEEQTENPFSQALGAVQSSFTGTSILAPSSNGSLNFIIPKQP